MTWSGSYKAGIDILDKDVVQKEQVLLVRNSGCNWPKN